MQQNTELQLSKEHLFRHESGKMLSVLVKLFGLPQVEVAEDIVQETLLFNEGYKSASETSVIRRDLCEEALRLGDLLCRHPAGDLPKTHALQALMCFHTSRFDARLDAAGDIILLEKQDRNRWNRAFITLGYEHLNRSAVGGEICEYHAIQGYRK